MTESRAASSSRSSGTRRTSVSTAWSRRCWRSRAGAAAPDAVDSLFRDAHTIKGGAGMVGLDEVRRCSPTRWRTSSTSARDSRRASRASSIDPLLRARRRAAPARGRRRRGRRRPAGRSSPAAATRSPPRRRPAPVAAAPAASCRSRAGRAARDPRAGREDRPAARPRRRDRAAPAAARARARRRAARRSDESRRRRARTSAGACSTS